MNSFKKRVFCTMTAAAVLAGCQVIAFASEDIIDEAEIYLNESAYAQIQGVKVVNDVEGTASYDITQSPAMSGGGNEVDVNAPGNEENDAVAANTTPMATTGDTDTDTNTNDNAVGTNNAADTTVTDQNAPTAVTEKYEASPNTGAPSLMLPVGIGLMALGLLPILSRKKG